MMRLLKAATWTAVAAGPLLLYLLLPRGLATVAIVVYLLATLWAAYAYFGAKHELATLRDAELDALFDEVFSDYEADLSRFPFRVHVFRRFGAFPVEKLEMIYSYRTHTTDPDREIRFYRYFGGDGEGLVWQSCQNTDVRFFRRDDVPDTKAAFHLRGAQDSATREVFAVLALPLRPLAGSNGAVGSKLPIGVLSFDAITPDGAESLEKLFNQFRGGEQPNLVELAERVSLYV